MTILLILKAGSLSREFQPQYDATRCFQRVTG